MSADRDNLLHTACRLIAYGIPVPLKVREHLKAELEPLTDEENAYLRAAANHRDRSDARYREDMATMKAFGDRILEGLGMQHE